jgi:hypothetical protein
MINTFQCEVSSECSLARELVSLECFKIALAILLFHPGCIPCKLYAEDTPILTINSIVISQTHAEPGWNQKHQQAAAGELPQ